MPISLETVLKAVQLAGVATPAFIELFGQVKQLFSPAEQAELQSAYEAAKQRSDSAHADLQDAAHDAQG